mgnify:FL=1
MSLSNTMSDGPEKKKKNKVILGPDSSGLTELSLDELDDRNRRTVWDESGEEKFFDRVRGRAKDKAKEIISQAMAEAEQLKTKAQEEGRAQGMESARNEVEALLDEKSKHLAVLLEQAQSGGKSLWNEHRQDIVALVSMAVEKVLAVELDRNREQILGTLLDEALDNIDSHRQLLIKVNPEDAELMRELLEKAAKSHHGLSNWKVKPDKDLEAGGVILESDQGMVDNSVQARREIILEIFDKLKIAEDEENQ